LELCTKPVVTKNKHIGELFRAAAIDYNAIIRNIAETQHTLKIVRL